MPAKIRADVQRIRTLNVTPGSSGIRIEVPKYEAMKKALLKVIPRNADGVAFRDLHRLVKPHLPGEVYTPKVSVPWYVTVVKLDLEARGLIGRVPGANPQRVRRMTGK
jgi:hypothetical protein